MSGAKIIEGLEAAVYGDLVRVSIPGPDGKIQHWVRRDEDERLRSLLDDLMKAVEPFANEYDDVADPCFEDEANARVDCTVGDLRRAREAYLKAKSHKNKEE